MLISMRRFKWGEIDLKFSADEDMRAIERKLLPFGTVTLVNYSTGVLELSVGEDDLDYVQGCIRRMRFKKPDAGRAALAQEGE